MNVEGHLPSEQLSPKENAQIKKLHDQTWPTVKESTSTVPTTDTLKEGWAQWYVSGSTRRLYYNVEGTVVFLDTGAHTTDTDEDTVPSGMQDYGTSASVFTTISLGDLYICYGQLATSGTDAVTNLPFTSNTSYKVTTGVTTGSGGYANVPYVTYTSGSQFTLTETVSGTQHVAWIAIGT